MSISENTGPLPAALLRKRFSFDHPPSIVDEAGIGKTMRVIPVIRCGEVKKSLTFYIGVLDFEKKYPEQSDEEWVIDLVQEDAEIQLSQHAGDGAFGCAINIRVKDVDGLFRKYLGARTGHYRAQAGCHCGPVDQTWCIREFYVTDRDGNTLRFGQPI